MSTRKTSTLVASLPVEKKCMGVNSLAQSITGWTQIYDQLSPGNFHGTMSEMVLGPAQLFMEFSSHALAQTCNTWPNALWFGVPVHREQVSWVEDTPIESNMIAVRHGQSEFHLTTPNNFSFYGVVVQAQTLKDYIAQEHGQAYLEQLLTRPTLKINVNDIDSFRAWLARLLHAFTTMPPQALEFDVMASILEDTLSHLSGLLAQQSAQPRERVSSVHAQRVVHRMREYVAANSDHCVKVHDLCETLGISRRALQDCFQKTMGCTPKAYLNAFRLNAARRDLEKADFNETSVSDVATRYGFWHLSQFAADYRKFFGELPSQTLREVPQRTAR